VRRNQLDDQPFIRFKTMGEGHLFDCVLPLVVGVILFLLVVDTVIGKRDRTATRTRIILGVIVLLAAGGLIVWRVLHTSPPPPLHTQTEVPLVSDPPDSIARATEARLDAVEVPVRDPGGLQVLGGPAEHGSAGSDGEHGSGDGYRVGDRRRFRLQDRQVETELIYASERVYSWLIVGVEADQQALAAAADRFDNEVRTVVRAFFSSQEPRDATGGALTHIVNYQDPDDGMSGFFYPATQTFYVNLIHRKPEKEAYLATLVHEFQHVTQWQNDPNEERWLDEGFSELAERRVDLGPSWNDEVFREAFDTQLNDWPHPQESATSTAHYGASYRFALYLWEQFGDTFIRDLAHHPANGMVSVDAVLADHGTGVRADEVFADWVVANAVDAGDYAYEREDWDPTLESWENATFHRYPMDIRTDVHPYATDYFRLEDASSLLIRFNGTTQARLLPEDPHSGETCWWSNAAHHTNTRLIRRFDLSGLSQATLRFWAWYELEEGRSQVYLSASGDGGDSWQVLHGQAATHRGDHGWGYTGRSEGWIEEEVDLSAYAGGEVRVRFDYVSDSSFEDKGLLVDDVSIPELDLTDPCEEVGDWEAEGFILAGPVVPVDWVVQIIDIYRWGEPVDLYRMSLDERRTGQLELTLTPLGGLLGEGGRGILAISALAHGTTVPLPYHCEITRRFLDLTPQPDS
jgi:hypothetical protein